MSSSMIKFKFLHKVGAHRLNWPRRDDIEEVHQSCVFYGPIALEQNGPFVISSQNEIEKIFSATR